MSPKNEAPPGLLREGPVGVIRIVCERHKRPRVVGELELYVDLILSSDGRWHVESYWRPRAAGLAGRYISASKRITLLLQLEALLKHAQETGQAWEDTLPNAEIALKYAGVVRGTIGAMLKDIDDRLEEERQAEAAIQDRRDSLKAKEPGDREQALKRLNRAIPADIKTFELTCPSCAGSKRRYPSFFARFDRLEPALDALAEQGLTVIEVGALRRVYDETARRVKNEGPYY